MDDDSSTQVRRRTANMLKPVLTTKQLGKTERKMLKEFKLNITQSLPKDLKAKYKKLRLRDKLFCLYYFDSATLAEAAMKSGHTETAASTRGSEAKRRCQGILNWIEERFLEEIGTRIATKNIISREVIIDKLARMFLPNLGDFDDLNKAKRKGLFDAVETIEYENAWNAKEDKMERKVKRIKLHSPIQTASLICKMMGYEAATKSELSYPGGGPGGEAPTINIQINMVQADGVK